MLFIKYINLINEIKFFTLHRLQKTKSKAQSADFENTYFSFIYQYTLCFMKDHQFKLVASTYPFQEAKEILLCLIDSKIAFLHRETLSVEERFGSDTTHLKSRLQALQAEREKLIEQFNNVENQDCLIEIDCPINLKVKAVEAAQ